MTAVQASGGFAGGLTVGPPRTGRELAKVLLVDDEPAVVSALRRQLTRHFEVETATDPNAALEKVAATEGLAVVVSDMRMPGMNGAEFLSRVRRLKPEAVRILLTGYADVDAAVAAVNEGQIFRFLSKPIPPGSLIACLRDAVRQHDLVTAERELLESTLRGSVKALLDTLSMANPMAFTRAARITRRVVELAEAVTAPALWEIEVASMLANIGAVTLPPTINERLHKGGELGPGQQQLVDQLPTLAIALLSGIPRLDNVRRIIRFQDQRFDGNGRVDAGVAGDDIPLGARLLRLATDYDKLEARGVPILQAISFLEAQEGLYDPELLSALDAVLNPCSDELPVAHVSVAELCEGMTLAADLETADGRVLCGSGQEVTEPILVKVHLWAAYAALREPVEVYWSQPGS